MTMVHILIVVGHFYWTMVQSKEKIKAIEFLRHIEALGQQSSDRSVNGFRGEETEKEFIRKIISETWELIEHNEWGIGLENLLSNLHEIDFKVDGKAIELAKTAIETCKMNYEDWKFIEELKK
jgi:hypothetical protein